MEFCTAINCMDGRTQLPVNTFLKEYYKAEYVDTITEPGPIKILSEAEGTPLVESIFNRVSISVDKHGSRGLGIVGHFGCAGNPVEKETQLEQLEAAAQAVKARYPDVDVIKLWVGDTWQVEKV